MITKEELLKWGMVETGNPVYPLRKKISKYEDDEISFVITHERNNAELALLLPDGILFLKVGSIVSLEILEIIESCILGYSSNY